MANQNLSQFGEKLFVADADHTFIWDTAASISKRVSRNSWLNSGTLTSDAPVTISQTWGTTGTYTAFKVVATETAVASTLSNLLELWSGSTPTLKVNADKSGNFAVTGTILADSNRSAFRDGGVTIGNAGALQWSQSSTAGATRDLFLVRDAANTLALRNGAAAQTFNVYGTYTASPLAYERLTISATGGVSGNAIIGTNKTGTGVLARGLEFQTDGVRRGGFNASGNFDVVASIATAAAVYVGASYNAITSPSAGVVKVSNTAENDFNRLQFGGTTNLFPAIKRSSTTLQARLADDSAFAPIQGKLTTETAFTATTVTPTGFITLYDSTGAAYKVPCVPA